MNITRTLKSNKRVTKTEKTKGKQQISKGNNYQLKPNLRVHFSRIPDIKKDP